MLIKKGMKVRVISGAHKGQEGKVLLSLPNTTGLGLLRNPDPVGYR